MVLLCLTYSVHLFILTYWDTGFHAAGTSTQLVDFPNRSTLYSADVGELQVDSRLCQVYYAYFHYGTIMNSSIVFVDIVKLSFVFIVSLVTYSGSVIQNVLYMKLHH